MLTCQIFMLLSDYGDDPPPPYQVLHEEYECPPPYPPPQYPGPREADVEEHDTDTYPVSELVLLYYTSRPGFLKGGKI